MLVTAITTLGETRVAVVGLGNMGAALARALLKRGLPVTVWNRTAGRAASLIREGAVPAAGLAEAVAAGHVVVACVSTFDVADTLFRQVRDELAGKTLVNLTTSTPGEARRTAAWAAEAGIQYLSGTVMATPPLVGRPETLIFYGGPEAAFARTRPLLEAFGGRAVYLGTDPGMPALYDLALLTVLYGAWYSWLHAHALVQAAGVAAAQFQPYVAEWLEHVIAPSLTDPAEAARLEQRDYRTDESNLAINQAAIDLIMRTSLEAGVSPEWLAPIHRLATQMVADGFGGDSFTRVFDGIRPAGSGR
ncbi:MAG: NAD(P)-binding domain-containing protein [Limnochordales bacterium]